MYLVVSFFLFFEMDFGTVVSISSHHKTKLQRVSILLAISFGTLSNTIYFLPTFVK